MTMKTQQLKTYGMQQKQFQEGSYKILPQETRKTNRQPKFPSKTTGKKKNKKPPKLVEGKKS